MVNNIHSHIEAQIFNKKIKLNKMNESNNNQETANGTKSVLSSVVFPQILTKWDTAIVDLNRNNGMFKFDNVRLRNCSLHFSETTGEYYVKYRDVIFSKFDIYNCR